MDEELDDQGQQCECERDEETAVDVELSTNVSTVAVENVLTVETAGPHDLNLI